MVNLICPVRHCCEILQRAGNAMVCTHGHNFDLARSGYLNLLQPQDRRAKTPGDARPAVTARRRFLDAGYEQPVLAALIALIDQLSLPKQAAVLDVGCGEGYYLGNLAAALPIAGYGIDLSTAAIELAARRYPKLNWLVANADRILPYQSGSFDLVISITARKNSPEFQRLLNKSGRLLVVVPAADDLIELREYLQGEAQLRDRLAATVTTFQDQFKLSEHHQVRHTVRLDTEAIRDLLTSTYRGARHSQQEKLNSLTEIEVTLSREICCFERLISS